MKHRSLLPAALFFCALFAAKSTHLSAQGTVFQIDTLHYRLLANEETFLLQNIKTQQAYSIPKPWLTPPKSEEYEDYVSELMEYDSIATAFPLGENLIGIHLSSYSIGDGSMALGQGLDVFLALDTVAKKVLPDVLHLGVTKWRSKFMGYLDAEYTHFLVNRYPRAKFYSLVSYQEKVYVHHDEELTQVTGPFYEQSPFRWYGFDGKKWSYDAERDKYLPLGETGELPLIRLAMTPVEWAKKEYERRARKGY